ncbi:hypothetical protein [Roseimicrobium gellanilyticum]|uniref:hypothetical protein n=1 Tax=Roseimicrobium gellanilyticum TaxID=748857 RepID=UPI001475B414|nr:hypothetical protein [Roseimicrobium gellanilyticum]
MGLIYPQDGTLSAKANFPGVSKLEDVPGMPRDVLDIKLLAPVNAKLVQVRASGVLTIGDEAAELAKLSTAPVKAGKYSGFDLLEKALAGHPHISLAKIGMGGQRMGGVIELKTDLSSISLLDLMFLITKEQGGNFWSIGPSEMKLPTPEGAKKPVLLLPFVLLATPPN